MSNLLSGLYQCCDHCMEIHGVCPDLEDNGGHKYPCPEGCAQGTRKIA